VVVVVVVGGVLDVTGGLVVDCADESVEEAELLVIIGVELLVIIISEVDPVAEGELLKEVSSYGGGTAELDETFATDVVVSRG